MVSAACSLSAHSIRYTTKELLSQLFLLGDRESVKPTPSYQKLRGGFYTPQPIADFLASWAIQGKHTRVLEPSCGDGEILLAAARRLQTFGTTTDEVVKQIHAVELDTQEAEMASRRLSDLAGTDADWAITTGDFFTFCKKALATSQRFGAIVGNPPFIRYQHFPESHRQIAFYLMQLARLHPNRLTNAWVPFLVAATQLLDAHGRMAMVIPAELLQVNYAAELRHYLSQQYSSVTLIMFRKLLFAGAQQEVVLFLGERDGDHYHGIRTIELNGLDDLSGSDLQRLDHTPAKEMDHSTEKWTMYFLDSDELALLRRLRKHPGLTVAKHVLDVDVGVVTGMNDFFVLSKQQLHGRRIDEKHTMPLVGRSAFLRGIVFSDDDWQGMVDHQDPAYLLTLPDVPFASLESSAQKYITWGEEQGWHTGYKCRIRKRWYVTPSLWTPQAFLLRQIHAYPKLIVNQAHAISTDTIHRVKLRNGVQPERLAAAFFNSLTFAFAEVIGRSYGGGLLEIEPNEAERLPIPLGGAESLDIREIDALVRAGKINDALDRTDVVMLRQGLGLSAQECRMIRGIWEKLRDRRINRKPEARRDQKRASILDTLPV